MTHTYLVSGATGTVGRGIVEELLARGHHVRALTRDPAKASFPSRVEVVRGDLTDPASLPLDGVTGVHLITFGGNYEPLSTGPQIVERLRAAGVRRVTVLNGGGPTPLQDAVCASDLAWTVVMPVEFMANALEWVPSVRDEAVVRAAFVDGLSAMVHERDIAAVAAVALSEDGHAGQEYVITGPEALTVPDKVSALSTALGREIRLVALSEEEFAAQARANGDDEAAIAWFIEMHRTAPPIGRTVVDTVEKVTGRPARSFAQWAAENAAAFRA